MEESTLKEDEQMKVYKQKNYHIIPFAFGQSYKAALDYFGTVSTKTNKSAVKDWSVCSITKQQLFHHIEELVSTEAGNGTIGRCFQLNQDKNVREKYNLPKSKDTIINMSIKNEGKYEFTISDIQLFIFETHIGFLLFKVDFMKTSVENGSCSMEDAPLKEIIYGNYNLKKFVQYNSDIFYGEKNKEGSRTDLLKLDLKNMVGSILEGLQIKTFFTHKSHPMNAVVFNSIILADEPNEDQIKEYLFEMRRSFKDSYKPASSELELEENMEIYQPFENIYWGVALEGMANLSFLVKDDKANKFLVTTFFGNLDGTYLLMYILELHKRYALLYYSIEASALPQNIDEYIDVNNSENENYKKLFQLKKNITLFKLRCVFNDLTNITHQIKLLDTIEQNLRIKNMMQEIESEIEALTDITHLLEERKKQIIKAKDREAKEQEEKRKTKFTNRVTMLTAVVALIALSSCVDPIIKMGTAIYYKGVKSFEFWLLIIIIIMILALIAIYKHYTKQEDKTKE
jgi:hypothetical protein